MKPQFSVIIPLYNKGNHIQRTIRSVLAQTYPYFEVIVVNDGSTDNSLEQIQKFTDSRMRIISQKNQGVSSARNNGIAVANNEWIAFLDADDEWYPEFLESILELKTHISNADVLASSFYYVNSGEKLSLPSSSYLFGENWQGIIDNYLEIINTSPPFCSSSFIANKQALESIGGFLIGVPFGEDIDLWIRLSLKSKIAYINKPLCKYHRAAENRACDLYYNSLDVFQPVKTLNYYLQSGEIPELQRQSAIEFIAKYNLPLAQSHLYYGNTKKAVDLILSCRGTRKYLMKKYWLLFFTRIPSFVLQFFIKIKHNILNPLFGIRYEN